jgi:hypothetical protein
MAVLAFEPPSETPQPAKPEPNAAPCPANAAAQAVVRIEIALETASWKLMQAGQPQDAMQTLEDDCTGLLFAAEAARNRLAAAIPTSHAGATAQLLAAIRDLRVRDDVELQRARQLEVRALSYLKNEGVIDVCDGRRLTQTHQSGRTRLVVGLNRSL